MDRWRGRVALVTGASVGIGAAICRHLANHGMRVIGCARNADKIKDIASEYPAGTIQDIKCDLTKEADILSLFEEIRSKYGRLDVCINNAGFSTNSTLLSGNMDEWRGMLDVNVLSLCLCTKEAVKLMREKEIDDGQIIHISSMAGHRIPNGSHFYSGTKFMVRALTEGHRRELNSLNSHIRVASISPGMVETEFMYRMYPDDPSKADESYKLIECLQSDDIAAAVISILQMPPHVNINDILIRPVEQKI